MRSTAVLMLEATASAIRLQKPPSLTTEAQTFCNTLKELSDTSYYTNCQAFVDGIKTGVVSSSEDETTTTTNDTTTEE